MADVFALFDDYAARFARGEQPDAREYLSRAGEGADELAAMIDRWLAVAPPPPPGEESVALARAWVEGQPPLLELRTRRGLRRRDVVADLIKLLGLDMAKRDKVTAYYHQLEGGLLEPRTVDRRVWAALARTLRARVEDLVAWRPRPMPRAEPAFYRAEEPMAVMAAPAAAPPEARHREPEAPDEIDELFGGSSPRQQ